MMVAVNECPRHTRREPNDEGWCQPICHHRGRRFVVISVIQRPGHAWFLDLVEETEAGDIVSVDELASGQWNLDPWDSDWQRAIVALRTAPPPPAVEREGDG